MEDKETAVNKTFSLYHRHIQIITDMAKEPERNMSSVVRDAIDFYAQHRSEIVISVGDSPDEFRRKVSKILERMGLDVADNG